MQARRSKIRPPRRSLTASLDFPTIWSSLSTAIHHILHQNASSLSFEELYRKAYTIVIKKHGGQLYDSIKIDVAKFLEECYGKLESKQDDELLDSVTKMWKDFEISMKLISDVFLYLDKVYTRENHIPLVYHAGVALFRDLIIKGDSQRIGAGLNEVILEKLTKNRHGNIVDSFKIQEVLKMYMNLEENDGETYYTLEFERFYLERSGAFYESQADDHFGQGNGRSYITWVDTVISDEEHKTSLYLSVDTIEKLKKLLNKICIVSRIDKALRFTNDGLKDWINHRKEDELRLLHKLLKKAGYFDGLLIQLDEIIREEEGLATPSLEGKIKVSQVSTGYITQIINLKDKYDLILSYLNADVSVQRTIESSFTSTLNQGAQPKISEFLSYYIDEFIKKSKDSNDSEIDSFLDNTISIFRFIKDKDVFEKFYKNHLAKRLLKSNSERDDDLERLLIEKFRNEIGPNFTSKLEGMFKDISLSRELSAKFNHKNLQVSILTTTFWPIQPTAASSTLNLPTVLEEIQSQFAQYHRTSFRNRNLQWVYNFGSLDIRIKFTKKIHELNCSVYCGVIILLFQEFNSLTYKQLKDVTLIPEAELQRALLSISVAPRTRVLKKSPMSREFEDHHVFTFNYDFTSPLTKVKILTVVTKQETDNTRSATLAETDTDRKHEVDAMIVRIMKSNKSLTHRLLIEEIIKLSKRFEPTPGFIKRRVENLIEREYLKRDDDDSKLYHYLA